MTVAYWIHQGALRLANAGFESSRLEAQLLVGHLFGRDRSWILANPELSVDEATAETLLRRRLDGEPLAYILGKREFFGRSFRVEPSVLIPRQETEEIVSFVLAKFDSEPRSVLDIGTGSGCLGITLSLERPTWAVLASDISHEALAIAQHNSATLRADVRFVKSDLFSAVSHRVDLIVSNPPYIGRSESLPREVVDFEPEVALFADEEGLSLYRRLANEGADYLNVDGLVVVEVGFQQSLRVGEIFSNLGWIPGDTRKDMLGHERVLSFSRQKVTPPEN